MSTTKKAAKKAPKKVEVEAEETQLSDLEWLESRPDVIESAWLYRDRETADQHEKLKLNVTTAKRMLDNANSKTRAKRAGLLRAAESTLEGFEGDLTAKGLARRYDFTLIGAEAVDALEWAHPPTEHQVQRAKAYYAARLEPYQDPGVDIDGHSIALMSKASHSPKLTEDEARGLWFSRKIEPRERSALVGAARRAQGYRDDPNQLAELVNLLGITS